MYTDNEIFGDSRANAVCDRIYFELQNAFPGLNLSTVFCLTGRAAGILQSTKITGPCLNIVFITNNEDIFNFTSSGLAKKLQNSGVIRFKERIIYYMGFTIIEFWYKSGKLDIVNVGGVDLQDISFIEEILL